MRIQIDLLYLCAYVTIMQATEELKQLMTDPRIIPILCEVLTSSSNAQVQIPTLFQHRYFLH